MDVGREVGSAIFIANEDLGVKVDLTDPEVVFYVEVRDNMAYLFQDYIRCHAGLPVTSQGKVIAVAEDIRGMVSAWLMMKRGCRVVLTTDTYFDVLRQYDPALKLLHGNGNGGRNVLGYVMGNTLENLKEVDVTSYDLPVFFPTIGMNDDEVGEIARTIEAGL